MTQPLPCLGGEHAVHVPFGLAVWTGQSQARKSGAHGLQEEKVVALGTALIVIDPSVPWKLFEMPMLTSHYETNGNDVYVAPRGAVLAISGGASRPLAPLIRVPDPIAARTLMPVGKFDGDQTFPLGLKVPIRKDRRQAEA
jgi:hypothetical protein